jgi:hypothetical protein
MSKLRISFGLHGTISKFPNSFSKLIDSLQGHCIVYIITDVNKKGMIVNLLHDAGFSVPEENILVANRKEFGSKCVSKIVSEMHIDMHFDSNPEYVDNNKCINFFIWPNTNVPMMAPQFEKLDRRTV